MQDINWNNFKAKFNGREQKSFETLCYHLFCNEFNIDKGIFGYQNQTGIETDPIKKGNEYIGWQAKYIGTKVSEYKDILINSIESSKLENPDLTTIYFYLNKNFTTSSKKGVKVPKYKTEIEAFAQSKGIKVKWRVPNHFERQLAKKDNESLAEHFFSLGKSIIDFVNEIKDHTDAILFPIRTEINFNGTQIKIDRNEIIKNLETVLQQSSLVIVSGEGGVGKTAVIKDFYNESQNKPVYIFKATEFNIRNINDLFKLYGNFTLSDFIKEHQGVEEKYIVIDSAEKLADIEHQEIFQEFLSSLLKNKWKILFTTRYSYLNDLKFQFVEIYQTHFRIFNIEYISLPQLVDLSKAHNFTLPDNRRLLELIQNPFYLNEYLLNYQNFDKSISYVDFKNQLWDRQILKSSYQKNNLHRKREKCFLEIAKERADKGNFFLELAEYEDEVVENLVSDEIIKYDSGVGGYFITHDIYEEWALDKIIEREFKNTRSSITFFNEIGSSLPIRRAFRNWLMEKLLSDVNEVRFLLEDSLFNISIEKFWQDEILVSVLLSDYSKTFFETFEEKLLEEDQNLLLRIIFLLRIACKDIDEDFLNLLGIQKIYRITIKTVFTKPKGNGWNCTIDFIYKNNEKLGLDNFNIILQLLYDWNNKNKEGKTTQKASLLALKYYEEITEKDKYAFGFRNDKEEKIVSTILFGASEIRKELTVIFDKILVEKKENHKDRYDAIVKALLSSITSGIEVVKCLPEYVIKLAELYWSRTPKQESDYYSRNEIENHFGISTRYLEYYPSSAYQTPVYQLLNVSLNKTLDFILSFTNKSVENYSKSEYGFEIKEIELYLGENEAIKQMISPRLWNMYRGTQVATHLLESIHMALEKWLLEFAKEAKPEWIERICLYLIRFSKSASITSVVMSIVLAQPSKLFNIALILFKTKEFFLYDTQRMLQDQTHKTQLLMLKNNFPPNYENEIYDNERIKACDDEHRKFSLEDIALKYQVFRTEDESEETAYDRQKLIWEVFDNYYKQLPHKDEETDEDKTWRLYLARMDRRKMNPKVKEEQNGKILIEFNPEIDDELKRHSEDASQKYSESTKYMPLQLWADYRYKNEESNYEKYLQYENNPQLVVEETKNIVEKLKQGVKDYSFFFYNIVPAFTCSVLLRDFFDKLDDADKGFCKEIIIKYATTPIYSDEYNYQVSDGSEPSITILPELIKYFPKSKNEIKKILFLLLLNPWKPISSFAIRAILYRFWEISFEDSHSIFLGYLLLKPKHDLLRERLRKENFTKKIFQLSETDLTDTFLKEFGLEIESIILNKIKYSDLYEIEKISFDVLNTAFELLPLKTKNEDHKNFLNLIFPLFAKKLFVDREKLDYRIKRRFLNKLAYFVLMSSKEDIEIYLKPFVENFKDSEFMADFFEEFVSVEDQMNKYEEFWIVWNAFYEKMVMFCSMKNSHYYHKGIIYNYLLAWKYWKEEAREWHSLKDRERLFYKKVACDMGQNPSVLYSISKLLNDIGSNFLNDGIFWLSDMIKNNKNLITDKLEVNTIYYLENLVRTYLIKNKDKVKRESKIKEEILILLNFLVERGSVTGYMLREDIL